MAQQHPYFAAAHFLLLKKMQDTDHPQFNTQLHKTTLYFNNPLWLQYLLQPETVADFTVSKNAPFISDEPAATPVVAEENENSYTNGYTPAAAYQLKEEEVLLEKEPPATTIEEPVVHQQEDTAPRHSNGGIMAVITEVFNEEQSNATHLPVFEGPLSATTDIPVTEAIINTEEVVENAEVISTEEGKQTVEEEKAEELIYTEDINNDGTAFFHEDTAEHLVGDEEKGNDAERLDDTKNEEQSPAEENAVVLERPYEYHEQENNNVA